MTSKRSKPPDDELAGTPSDLPRFPGERTRPRVLVAEDQPAMRHLLGKALREAGYEVTEFADGTSLWNELRLLNDPSVMSDAYAGDLRDADLIVSDIRMPGPDGLEVLSRLRATDWTTPVILITAFGGFTTMVEGMRLGAARIFSKPFDVKALVEAARALVDPSA